MNARAITIFSLLTLLPSAAQAEIKYTIGAEGFRDTYQEPIFDLKDNTNYTSGLASVRHDAGGYFTILEGRYSYGTDHYKADGSGTASGSPQYEGDVRLRTGTDVAMWHGHMMPYIGLGLRMFLDQGKGKLTSTGDAAYDRHINQVYIPIGSMYQYTAGSWIFTPMVEVDPLLYGQVQSNLRAIGVTQENPDNTQKRGLGLRAEFMTGQQLGSVLVEAGPFIRYWRVEKSDLTVVPDNAGNPSGWEEPANSRLQAGGELRVTY